MSAKKKASPKSPPTPSYSIKESLDDARKVYANYSHAGASREEVAHALGLKASSGTFARRFFTLREYGLLEPGESGFVVTERFHSLNTNAPDTPNFKQAAFACIRNASTFSTLLDEFRGTLPPESTITKRLETKMRFNASRAAEVAAVLKEGLDFAGVLGEKNNILPVRDEVGEGGESSEEEDELKNDLEEISEGALRSEFPLPNNRRVTIVYPSDITPDEATKISEILSAIASVNET